MPTEMIEAMRVRQCVVVGITLMFLLGVALVSFRSPQTELGKIAKREGDEQTHATGEPAVAKPRVQPEQVSPSAESTTVSDRHSPEVSQTALHLNGQDCMPFEQLQQSEQWRKSAEWMDSLGIGIASDIANNTRETQLSHYLDLPAATLTERVQQGDSRAKLVKAELYAAQAEEMLASPDGDWVRARELLQEARQLWWDAVVDGGYTLALTSMGMSYAVEAAFLRDRGQLDYGTALEFERRAYQFGEAPELLIEGLGERFFEYNAKLAPTDVLVAALDKTVAEIEAERLKKGLPSLRSRVPPARDWLKQQRICHD